MQVSAGVGPFEVRAFVALLARELEAQCVRAGLAVESVSARGDDDAPRSVELAVFGPACEVLAGSLGTHALVARSALRGRRSRKRWFADVGLHQRGEDACRVELRRADLEVTAARAGGPGGQGVNTTDSAVRVLHKPSGISVRNILKGTVALIVEERETAFAEVLVDIGGAGVRARITRAALADLALKPEMPVYVLVKSIAFDRRALSGLQPPPAPPVDSDGE